MTDRSRSPDSMNIFLTDKDPLKCAEGLDDYTLQEQMKDVENLVYVALTSGGIVTNKPCLLWVFRSRSNAHWAYAYAVYLCEEYMKRFGKRPAQLDSLEKLRSSIERLVYTRADQSDESEEKLFPTDWINDSVHKDVDDPVNAYRMQLNDMWDAAHMHPVWTNRRPPPWARWRHDEEHVRTDEVSNRYHYRQRDRRRMP